MKRWVGRSIAGIGFLHTVFGLAAGAGTALEIVEAGLIDAVDGHAGREAFFWFVYFGVLTMLFGIVLDRTEAFGFLVPRSVGVGLGGMSLLGVTLMPASGWWLLLVPAVGLLVQQSPRTAASRPNEEIY